MTDPEPDQTASDAEEASAWDDARWNDWLEAESDRPHDPVAALEDVTPEPEAPVEAESADEPGTRAPTDEAPARAPVVGSPEPARRAEDDIAYPEAPCWVTVRQGDCVLSLAHRYRVSPEVIWRASENDALRRARKRNVLLPGDAVFVPARAPGLVSADTGQRHRFELRWPPVCVIKLRFLREGEARGGLRYRLAIEGDEREGETDGEGRLTERVAAGTREATLTLCDVTGDERYRLRLGHLDPLEEDCGVRARLRHLGHPCDATDGGVDAPRTRRAIRAFQRARGLDVTGVVDAATRAALAEAHGS